MYHKSTVITLSTNHSLLINDQQKLIDCIELKETGFKILEQNYQKGYLG